MLNFRERLAVCLCFVLAAVAASSYGYTVAANETVTVTDANVADYASGFSFADDTGVIEFATSSAPTMDITGSGTVKKTYNGDWTMTKRITNFTGTYDLCGTGVVGFSTDCVFGKDDSSSYKLYVRSGATLNYTATTAKLNKRTLHVAGYGAEGAKAAIVFNASLSETSGATLQNLFLEDDASLYIGASANIFFKSGTFDMNGHRLFFSGSGYYTATTSHVMKSGEIVARSVGGENPQLVYRVASIDKDSPTRLVFNGSPTFQLTDKTTVKPESPIWISGTLKFQRSDYWNNTWWEWSTNAVGWAGPIVFTNETGMSEMKLDIIGYYSPRHQINFMGPISGNGQLTLSPPADMDMSRVCLGSTNNTFTGRLFWNGNGKLDTLEQVRLLLLHPGSVPNYSNVTCNYGHIDCVFDSADTEAPWDFAHFADFANKATWVGSSFAAITGPGGDGAIEPMTFSGAVTNAIGAKGSVNIVGGGDGAFSNLVWAAGTARIGGPGKYNVGSLKIKNGSKMIGTNSYPAVVELSGGGEFVTGKAISRIGYLDAANLSHVGRLVVSNAFIHGPADQPQTYGSAEDYALAIGGGGAKQGGILEVCDGAVVSNKLCTAAWNSSINGRGLVIQRGGKVYSLGATSNTHLGPALGMSGHGTYIMHKGEFTAFASFHIGGYNSGNWTQYGGTAVFTNYPGSTKKTFDASSLNGGWGEIYLAGGKMHVFSDFGLAASWESSPAVNGKTRGKLVVDGPGSLFDLHGNKLIVNRRDSNVGQMTVRRGGTVRATGMVKDVASGTFVVCFDGGTFKCGGSGKDIFSIDDATYANAMNLVAVFPGGMTVDAADGDNYTGVPIKGATGGGVSQVPFDEPVSGCDGIVQPYVDIVGDGLGATAVALFDTEACKVTNIIVTCPGVDYTTATARVCVAKSCKKTIVLDDYIVPNVNNGGFTKKGGSVFTLKATNTWGGATAVAGGTLKADVDWAIPAGTDLLLSGGGVMDFNGKTGEVATVTYGAGGGEFRNAANVRFASDALRFTISAEELAAGKSVTWNGDLDLSEVTLTVTGDLSVLSADTRYTVVEVSGGVATGEPTIISSELPANWAYRFTPKGVKLGYVKGYILLIH